MKILVTGYKGFIGQNMVESLLADGHEVFVYHWGDVWPTWDLNWVIHLGAISTTTESNVEKIVAQNYEFTIKLLERCNQEIVHVQYASSASVYGLNCAFSEESKPDPRTPYAWTKYMIDRYVASKSWNINVQGFRYFNVYGPHEEHKIQPSPFTVFRRQAKETGIIKVFENSEHIKRDFVPVADVIEVHKKFFNVFKSGVWNIGTGVARSFLSVANEVAEETPGTVIETIPMPDILKANYQYFTQADLTKLKMTLSDV